MTFKLTIWSRDGEVRFTLANADAGAVRDAWTKHRGNGFGLVSLTGEDEPEFPTRRAFIHDRLLLTALAHEARGGFATVPLGGRFGHLHAVRRGGGTPAVPAADGSGTGTPSPGVAVPLLASDLVDRLRDVEVANLTSQRRVRSALVHLDVRLVSDLSGVSEADLLRRLDGDLSLVRAFREQAQAYAARSELLRQGAGGDRERPGAAFGRLPSARTWREAEARLRAEEKQRAVAASAADRKAREAAFRTQPLSTTVRNSLAHLDERNAALLARKFGLDGRPETALSLAGDFGVTRARVLQIVEQCVARLARRDGWPLLLKDLARDLLPLSAAEISRDPWLDGLDPERLGAIAWFGTGERVFLLETSSGPVVGHLNIGDWNALRSTAREVVLAADLDATPAQVLAALRAAIPEGARGYERFLLHEIGCPSAPGRDWLLHLKGGLSPTALIRQVAGSVDVPLATRTLVEGVKAFAPGTATHTLRGIVCREAQHLADGRWRPRRRWDPEDPVVERVRRACERHFARAPDDAPPVRAASLAAAIAGDPELDGVAYDLDAVALAVRTSGRLAIKGPGWIVPSGREAALEAHPSPSGP